VRAAHRGGVQQEVDEVVVQQVDLVHVEHAAVRLGEQPGLVGADALGQRALQVQRPDQPVLRGPDGQLDQPRGAGAPGRGRLRQQGEAVPPAHLGVGAVGGVPGHRDRSGGGVRTVGAARIRGGRVAGEPAIGHHCHVRQQRGQRPHRRRLRRALLPPHQHAAHAGVHGVEQQCETQIVVADDGGEREPDDGSAVRCDARH
jgi:hypothetical protein